MEAFLIRGWEVILPGRGILHGSIFDPGMGTYPPRVRRDARRWPEGQLSPRAGSMSPSQSAITQ